MANDALPQTVNIAQLGAEVLRQRSAPLKDITSARSQQLIDELFRTCEIANGMGIAAPQMYKSVALFILASKPNNRYRHAPHMQPTAIINPVILEHSTQMNKAYEGCLSLPGIRALVPRYDSIVVQYTTRHNECVTTQFDGFLARVFQHEYDHLEGLVFLDRIESTHDVIMEQEYQRIMASHTIS